MKNRLSIVVLAAALFASCQSETSKKTAADSTIATHTAMNADSSTCYQYIKNRDTAHLSINQNGKTFSGTLSYNLYEKDKNSGTISGIIKGDTLIADYTFQSEGTKSIREVAWLKQGDKLVEGFGDVEEQNGKTRFKEVTQLKFDSSLIFEKQDCK